MKRERHHSRSIENDTDTEYWSLQRLRLPSHRNTIRITNGASWYLRPLTIHVRIRFSIYEYVSRFSGIKKLERIYRGFICARESLEKKKIDTSQERSSPPGRTG